VLFAKLNNVTLHHQLISGPADKPVLVFVNSLGTDFRIWRDVIVALAGQYPILTYDKRGHGLSDLGAAPYAMQDHVNDLAALLDHLKVRQAIICGLSVGGMIALGLHEARPDLVKALVLCDTAHKIGNADGWNARIKAVEEQGLSSIADSVMERWFTPQFRAASNPAYPGYVNMLIRQPAEGYAGTCAALRDADMTNAARMVTVPTLCVVGDQDGSTPPELVRSMADLIAESEFMVIEGSGHIPCVEQPERFIATIRLFLDKI
jgi:3-oxoadipate enol-lactonase